MTKILLLLFSISILIACQKDTVDLGLDYQKMIGNWISLNQDYPVKISFTEKNLMTISRSIERGVKFKVESISKKTPPNMNGWSVFTIYGNTKKTSTDYILFYSNSTFDTLEIYTGSEIVDQQLYVEFDNKFIRE